MARLSLADIRAEVKARVHDSTLTNAQVDRWANIAQDGIIRKIDPGWLEDTCTFSTVADQRKYFIEDVEFYKVKGMVDETSRWQLTQVAEKYIEETDPALIRKGRPYLYTMYGTQPFEADLPAANTITVVSSSAADTAQTVLIRGEDAAGTPIKEVLTLNGAVAVNGTTSFTKLTHISKSDATTGYVTVYSVDGLVTTTHVIIPADQLERHYQPIALYPIPTDVRTIRVRYIRQTKMLTEEEDTPDLPDMWHDLVMIGTLIQAHEYLYEFEKAVELKGQMAGMEQNLKSQTTGNYRDNSRKIRVTSLKRNRLPRGRIPEPVS